MELAAKRKTFTRFQFQDVKAVRKTRSSSRHVPLVERRIKSKVRAFPTVTQCDVHNPSIQRMRPSRLYVEEVFFERKEEVFLSTFPNCQS